ncbi:hypothetical protein [Sporosarcina trichiuri]|uniref:hypothetical protein n=1 Tax=Sporosarcina trichiuri TaxID=3056445 RepID=UPI0025B4760E|nr:hypothetical protein [Sporosarcina sp. 0.2-SM1T-5]WJY27609.1 hypothetical protein QWT68_00905 [Sporosarcina sp. 0.2-SM1T-5]
MNLQNRLFLLTGAASLVFAYCIYLTDLFALGDAHMAWLVFVSAVSAVLMYKGMGAADRSSRRAALVLLVLLAAGGSAYGIWLAVLSGYAFVVQLTGWLAMTFAAAALCSVLAADRREGRFLHVVNIVFGFLLTAGTARLLYEYYLFSEDGRGAVWLLGIPLALFAALYSGQALLGGRQNRLLRLGLGIVQLLLPLVLYFLWRTITAGEGWI